MNACSPAKGYREVALNDTIFNSIKLLFVLQGLINLVGLTIAAVRPRGGFSYTHPPTGFIFEIVNDDSDSEDEAGSLIFNPLSFGSAGEVTHL